MQNSRVNYCEGHLLEFRCVPANLRKWTPVWLCAFPNFSRIVIFESASERLLLNWISFIKLLVLRLHHHLPPADFKHDISNLLTSPEETSLRFNRLKRSSFSWNISTLPSLLVAWCKNWLTLFSIKKYDFKWKRGNQYFFVN